MTLEQLNLALAALLAMSGGAPEPGARTLVELLELHGQDAAAEELERWLERRGA